ncbi:hypothetical protein TTHERM_00268110 (macronuclear) [Tetrahymena thermophila SB210]|uniref:Uncharacterized protein n=1 Tax=Tetrahymena thermophila (strain SB210) TaxID=312017 RepID=I7MIZ8_TETTS|nr:hypothetical protein TTHERM_00268110 [Tetrahymena thermophila SB210]EAR95701.2 hypothetical protein TTHERM_00268110 [Tetrahymena thermophila SB210]|eukprot:XP_001015946.2 hypothetical protein TTHERM_00268110 [Tetrahymena thermophila SB210]
MNYAIKYQQQLQTQSVNQTNIQKKKYSDSSKNINTVQTSTNSKGRGTAQCNEKSLMYNEKDIFKQQKSCSKQMVFSLKQKMGWKDWNLTIIIKNTLEDL